MVHKDRPDRLPVPAAPDTRSDEVRARPRGGSLVRQLTLLALIPTAAIALLVVGLSTYWQRQELHDLSIDAAKTSAMQIAHVAAEPILDGDRDALAQLAGVAARQRGIEGVRIAAADGTVLASSARQGQAAGSLQTMQQPVHATSGATVGTVSIEVGLDDVLPLHRTHAGKVMALLLLSLLATWLIGWRAARWIGAPIGALARAVNLLGQANKPIEVEVTADGEIGQLQRGFNTAAAALHDSQRNMHAQIEQATLALEQKNAALETAGHARALFLAAASHDLRQPLYALTLFCSAMELGEKDPTRLGRIARIQDCVGSLDHLFNELLDLSRLDAGAMQPSIEAFELDLLFDEVSRTFRMAAEERGLRLQVRKTDLWVRSDRVMLLRVLNNLVSNAVRYTQSGGVLVGARRHHDGVRIDVWDTGPGISQEHQAHVFEAFYQAQCAQAGDGARRGLGLGLATVQRLCELLALPVSLRSLPDHGSVFSVLVPPAPAARRLTLEAALDRPLDVSGLRVLVIDDEPVILEGIRLLMGNWGCDVRTAEDAEQALQAVRAWGLPPDIVISDLQLGAGRSGLDALTALARHYNAGLTPPFARLLITGETKSERLREISAARIPVLYKPVTPDQLREAMVATLTIERTALNRAAA